MSVQLLRRKFTVEQYHKMLESGIFTENDRVELIAGEIIEMAAIGRRHAACVRRLDNLFSQRLSGEALVDTQNPIQLNDNSEPQPDVVLLKPRDDFYESAHPQPSDIFLLIEVADATIKYDREVKVPLYAKDNILEVWLVDINEQSVEVYREATSDGYRNIQQFSRGQTLSIQAFPEINITVNEVLGL
ncbi:MAG: Uma2 family endonuclease [Potamolinea sp.]